MVQSVDVLCYKPEGLGFNSRWCHCNFFYWHNPSRRTMLTQLLTEMSTRNISCGLKAVWISRNLSRPVQGSLYVVTVRHLVWAGIAQSVQRLAKLWTVRGSNPGEGEIFRTRPGAYPVSCTMGTGSFPGVKRPGRGADHSPPSKCRGHERVGLCLYSPSGSSLPVMGWTFTNWYSSFKCVLPRTDIQTAVDSSF